MRIDTDYAGILFVASVAAICLGYTSIATYLVLSATLLVTLHDRGKLFRVSV